MATSRTGTTKWRRLRAQAIRKARAAGQDRCPECGTFLNYHQAGLPNSAEADHITAHALGGEDEADNIAIICRSCNATKGGKIGNKKRAAKIQKNAHYKPVALDTALD